MIEFVKNESNMVLDFSSLISAVIYYFITHVIAELLFYVCVINNK